jgi:hypothetical protein
VQAVFLTFGLHTQLAYLLRSSMWLALWFAVMNTPLSWAKDASVWNDLAERRESVWSEEFEKAHRIVWKLLASYVIYTFLGLLRSATAKYLSLQFHHKNHFERMQVR